VILRATRRPPSRQQAVDLGECRACHAEGSVGEGSWRQRFRKARGRRFEVRPFIGRGGDVRPGVAVECRSRVGAAGARAPSSSRSVARHRPRLPSDIGMPSVSSRGARRSLRGAGRVVCNPECPRLARIR